jgi:hypothetical protein
VQLFSDGYKITQVSEFNVIHYLMIRMKYQLLSTRYWTYQSAGRENSWYGTFYTIPGNDFASGR